MEDIKLLFSETPHKPKYNLIEQLFIKKAGQLGDKYLRISRIQGIVARLAVHENKRELVFKRTEIFQELSCGKGCSARFAVINNARKQPNNRFFHE